MKLSGHSYDNDVFSSLLDGICEDVKVTKTAQKEPQAPIQGSDVFSSTTEDTLKQVQSEHLESIAAELQFAADRAKVAITRDDLATFAKTASQKNLRGKDLERTAQNFCNNLYRDVAPPQGAMRGSTGQGNHAIASATYDPRSHNETRTGGYMGQTSNPNSIWDSTALQQMAQVQTGDEKIADSKKARQEFKEAQKKEEWMQKQAQAESNPINKGITNMGSSPTEEVVNQNLPSNSMSVFSKDRDFNNIPMETDGERIAKLAAERASKVAEAKKDWNKVESAQKISNSDLFDKVFAEKQQD